MSRTYRIRINRRTLGTVRFDGRRFMAIGQNGRLGTFGTYEAAAAAIMFAR